MLNFHHLHYFWTVAREGSIARATKVLGVAQPTISGQIRELERAIGEKLFERRGRNLVLTGTGHVVARYAEEIFSLGRELLESVHGHPTGGPLRFTVGVSDSLPKLTTWRILQPALALRQPCRMVLRIDKTERLLSELAVHALDLVIADQPVPPVLRVRAFNHLLGECGVTIFGQPAEAQKLRRGFPGSLQGAPFVLQTENTALRRSLDQWFDAHGIRPAIVAEVEDVALLQVLGQHGMGLFAAPSVVEDEIRQQYGVHVVGRLDAVRERFYAITVERKLKHPAAVAIQEAARGKLFSD